MCYIGIDKGRKTTPRFLEEVEDPNTNDNDNENNNSVQSKDIDDLEKIKDKEDTNGVDKVTGITELSREVTGVAYINKLTNKIAINTIQDSRNIFIKRDQRKVDIVQRFQYVARVPTIKTILHLVSTNSIKNNPIIS